MEVTGVRVTKNERILSNPQLKGFANVTIDGAIAINGIGIVEGEREGKKEVFLSFPSRKVNDQNGTRRFRDIAFPITTESREKITDSVLKVYNGK